MSDSCCGKKIESSSINDLWRRSISLIGLGGLMMLPGLEHTLMMGTTGYITFAASTLLITNTVINDYKDSLWFVMNSVFSTSVMLFAPMLSTLSLQWLSVTSSLGILGASLFINKDKNDNYSLIPPLEKIILLSSSITWVLAASSMLSIAPILNHVMLHDALLSIGFFNFGSYIRQSLQTNILKNNYDAEIEIQNEDGELKKVKLNQLKQGMKIVINKRTNIPVSCTVDVSNSNCLVNEDSAEGSVIKQAGDKIPPFSVIHQGTLICNEDYKHINTDHSNDETDSMLKMFLSSILGVSLASGLINSLSSGTLIAGLQSFVINFMSCCPCVFLVATPIILAKILQWATRNNFEPVITSSINKPNIIVFDRTNTLYEQDTENPNGPYKLIPGAKDLLKRLIDKGIEVYILSGHSTNGHEENLANCRKELSEIGVKSENIIFDGKYNGEDSKKVEAIKNLKLYGSVEKPESQSFMQSFISKFRNNIVWMIGDGFNDRDAIKIADLGICVGAPNAFNDDVAKNANLLTTPRNLTSLDKLVDVFSNGVNYVNAFTGFALIYNTFMLSAVNGAFYSLLGFSLTPSMACLGMSVCCVSLLISASMVNISGEENDSPTKSIYDQLNVIWKEFTELFSLGSKEESCSIPKKTHCCHH